MSGKRATRWSIAEFEDKQLDAAALGGEKVRPGDEEDEQRILLETGGDEGDSSKMFDLFPHTTADMFRYNKEMFSISLYSLSKPSALMQI